MILQNEPPHSFFISLFLAHVSDYTLFPRRFTMPWLDFALPLLYLTVKHRLLAYLFMHISHKACSPDTLIKMFAALPVEIIDKLLRGAPRDAAVA